MKNNAVPLSYSSPPPSLATAENSAAALRGGSSQPTDNTNTENSIEATYISLIQQYLSLFQNDNATFLAERFVAFHSTPYSNYLLAMCYYRSNKVQYAKRVLTNHWNQKKTKKFLRFTTSSSSSSAVSAAAEAAAVQEVVMEDNIIYLLAKCNVDLEKWKDAEDLLLKNARMKYVQYKKMYKEEKNKEEKLMNVGRGGEEGTNRGGNETMEKMATSVEEYLIQLVSMNNRNSSTTAAVAPGNDKDVEHQEKIHEEKKKTNPSIMETILIRLGMHDTIADLPISNGAAGLHLLGTICHRTMRKDKAAIYYKLALKVRAVITIIIIIIVDVHNNIITLGN